MQILTLSGSGRPESGNLRLLKALPELIPGQDFLHADIHQLPLFNAAADQHPWPPEVIHWRTKVQQADALLICTPAYLHNIPAALKNALEWLKTTGELSNKRVLPITFTPHPPRGEQAMESLCWSLQALNANILTRLSLYQQETFFDEAGVLQGGDSHELLQAALEYLIS